MRAPSASPATAAQAATLAATIGAGAAGWVLTVSRIRGMDMGTEATLGSFPHFLLVWVPMMAAMMLPGTAPSALRVAASGNRLLDGPLYSASYLAVWSLAGAVVFALYRPHGAGLAGTLTVTAGLYELTPVKQRFRRTCQERCMPGWGLGLCCLASSGGPDAFNGCAGRHEPDLDAIWQVS